MIKAILFDLDGTLITNRKRFYKVFNFCLKHIFNTTVEEREFLEKFNTDDFTSGTPFIEFFVNPTPEQTQLYWEMFLREYRKDRYWKDSVLIDGTRKTLESLKSQGLTLVVMTGGICDEGELEKELKEYGISELFDSIIPSDKPTKNMNKEMNVQKALEKLSIKPEECVIVGDFASDILTAKNLGIKGILIGNRKFDNLIPDARISSILELDDEFLEKMVNK